MRKMSELLEICKTEHISYGGDNPGMCTAASTLCDCGLLTKEESDAVRAFCMDIVFSFNTRYIYIADALTKNIFPFYRYDSEFIIQTLAQIYDCVIDKLKSEGN